MRRVLLLVLLAAFLAKGRSRGAAGWARALLAAGLMLSPQHGPTYASIAVLAIAVFPPVTYHVPEIQPIAVAATAATPLLRPTVTTLPGPAARADGPLAGSRQDGPGHGPRPPRPRLDELFVELRKAALA